jgi:hypothetical protein
MDALGLVVTVLFMGGGLLIIPLNQWLDERRVNNRRAQAHRKRRGDRW